MERSGKHLRRVWIGLAVLAVATVIIVVGPVRRVSEFNCAEGVKGYWASLQDFVKQNGHYPKDEAERIAFFQTTPDNDPVEYVAPQDDAHDEVVLWWKRKTLFGVNIGITESGTIVKK